MINIDVKPNLGADKVILGMSKEQVHNELQDKRSYCNTASSIESYYSGIFRVHYDENDNVNFIEIANPYTDEIKVIFEGISVFETRADKLVKFIEQYSTYDKNDDSSVRGFSYIFKGINLSLWRSNVLRTEQLSEQWFKDLSEELQQEEMKFLYFESIGLAINGYWK